MKLSDILKPKSIYTMAEELRNTSQFSLISTITNLMKRYDKNKELLIFLFTSDVKYCMWSDNKLFDTACKLGLLELVKIMIKNNSNLDISSFNNRPLRLAYHQNRHDVCFYLIKFKEVKDKLKPNDIKKIYDREKWLNKFSNDITNSIIKHE